MWVAWPCCDNVFTPCSAILGWFWLEVRDRLGRGAVGVLFRRKNRASFGMVAVRGPGNASSRKS